MSSASVNRFTDDAKSTSERRSVRDPEQGVYEYLEEVATTAEGGGSTVIRRPLKLSGWLWRREGLFRRFRRRFCVFKPESSALFVFAGDDTVNGRLLRRVVVTSVRLTSRADRALHIQGYAENRELHKKQSDSMAQRASTRSRALPGDRQRFFLPEDEFFKAVTGKALTVWTHCFKHHMKSYRLRRQRRALSDLGDDARGHQEDEQQEHDEEEEGDEMDPDFVYEEVDAAPRRHSLPAAPIGLRPERAAQRSAEDSALSKVSRQRSDYQESHRRPRPEDATQLEYDQDRSIYITKLHRGSFGEDHKAFPMGHQPQESLDLSASREQPDSLDASQSNAFSATPSEMASSSATLSSLMHSTQSIWADDELLEHRVDFDAIAKTKPLATGAYGEVWLAQYRSRDVVIKYVKDTKPNASKGRQAIQRFIEEIKIHARLDHKRIVSFRGVAWTKERDVRLMMEYLPKGDLRTFLEQMKQEQNNKFTSIWTWTKYQWRIAIDVIEGLVYLHSLNPALVHSDIKSGNILLREDLSAKIGDFGLSRYVEAPYLSVMDGGENNSAIDNIGDSQRDRNSDSDNSSCDYSEWHGRAKGTGRWMAPEILTGGQDSSMSVDVYAFGIVLSEIDTCEIPFRDRSLARSNSNVVMSEDVLVHHIVSEGWKPTFRVTCPDPIKQLATECLARDPRDRPTSLEVAHRLRKAASQRERPDVIAAQAASLRIR